MPFGQSIPASSPASLIAGFIGGELCRIVAEEFGANEFGKRAATFVGHTAASMATGYTINALGGADVTGAAATTLQSPLSAAAHTILLNSKNPLLLDW